MVKVRAFRTLENSLRRMGFNQPAAVVSAYDPDELPRPDAFSAHLSKPYRPHELAAMVRRVMDEHHAV